GSAGRRLRSLDRRAAGRQGAAGSQAREAGAPVLSKTGGSGAGSEAPRLYGRGGPLQGKPERQARARRVLRFQCPFCRRHALATQPILDERFVKTWDVLWVAKHFPLRIDPRAPVAAAAAECAGDQGKFWAMHHELFEKMERWSKGDDPDAALVGL